MLCGNAWSRFCCGPLTWQLLRVVRRCYRKMPILHMWGAAASVPSARNPVCGTACGRPKHTSALVLRHNLSCSFPVASWLRAVPACAVSLRGVPFRGLCYQSTYMRSWPIAGSEGVLDEQKVVCAPCRRLLWHSFPAGSMGLYDSKKVNLYADRLH